MHVFTMCFILYLSQIQFSVKRLKTEMGMDSYMTIIKMNPQ